MRVRGVRKVRSEGAGRVMVEWGLQAEGEEHGAGGGEHAKQVVGETSKHVVNYR